MKSNLNYSDKTYHDTSFNLWMVSDTILLEHKWSLNAFVEITKPVGTTNWKGNRRKTYVYVNFILFVHAHFREKK